MGSAFHQLCPRYSGTLTPTAPTAIKLWDTFTFTFMTYSVFQVQSIDSPQLFAIPSLSAPMTIPGTFDLIAPIPLFTFVVFSEEREREERGGRGEMSVVLLARLIKFQEELLHYPWRWLRRHWR